MIIENMVYGSSDTTLHTYTFAQVDMDVIMSLGSYVQGGVEKISSLNTVTIDIPISTLITHYEIWLSLDGVVVLDRNDGENFGVVIKPIDKLAWFTVPANAVSLDDIEINTVRVVEEV